MTTIKDMVHAPVNPFFSVAVKDGKYECGNRESYYAKKLPDETFSYDISNNKVLANTDEFGTLKTVTFYRGCYPGSMGLQRLRPGRPVLLWNDHRGRSGLSLQWFPAVPVGSGRKSVPESSIYPPQSHRHGAGIRACFRRRKNSSAGSDIRSVSGKHDGGRRERDRDTARIFPEQRLFYDSRCQREDGGM